MKKQKNNQQKNNTINIINNFIDGKEIQDYYIENKNIYKILLKNNIDVFNDVSFLELNGTFTAAKIAKLIDIESNNIMIISKKNGDPVRCNWSTYKDIFIYNYDVLLQNPTRSNEDFNETRKEPTRSTLVVYQDAKYFLEIRKEQELRKNNYNFYNYNLVKRLKNYEMRTFYYHYGDSEKYININNPFYNSYVVEYEKKPLYSNSCYNCYNSKNDVLLYNNDNILKIVDKSGYLRINIINDLKERFTKYKAEQDQKRCNNYDFSDDIKKIDIIKVDLKKIFKNLSNNININIKDDASFNLLKNISDSYIYATDLKSKLINKDFTKLSDAKKYINELIEQYNYYIDEINNITYYVIERYSWQKRPKTPQKVTSSRFNWLINYYKEYNHNYIIKTAKNGNKIMLAEL